MGRLSSYTRSRIVSLRRQGLTFVSIGQRLREEDNISASRQAISNFWRNFEATGAMVPRHGGGKPASLKDVHLNFLDEKLHANSELTAKELQKLLLDTFGLEVSVPTILRGRKKLGWQYGVTRYCQLISDKNKPERLSFAQACLDSGETFDDVIFVDECIVQMGANTKRQCYKKGAPLVTRLRAKPKHPYQVGFIPKVNKCEIFKSRLTGVRLNAKQFSLLVGLHLLLYSSKVHTSHELCCQAPTCRLINLSAEYFI